MAGMKLTGDWGKLAEALTDALAVDWRGVHAEIGEYLVSDTGRRFKTERDPKGAKWKKSKRAAAEGGKTLTDKAILRRGIKMKATHRRVDVGFNIIYGRIHNLGGRTGRDRKVKMPKRQFLGINHRNRREIGEIIRERVIEPLRR